MGWPTRYGNGWMLVGALAIVGVGIAAGAGHLGVAFCLLFLAPLPATIGARRARRAAGHESLALLRALPIAPTQQRFFTSWFLFMAFMAVALGAGLVAAGVRALV